MKECHGPTVVMKAGIHGTVRTQVRGTGGTRLRYRLDYRLHAENALYTAYSNEFTVEPKDVAGTGQ